MTVKYISTFSVKSHHSMINRGLMMMLCRLYPGKVECYAPGSAVENLKSAVDYGSVKRWHRLFIASGKGRIGLTMRYISSAICNVWLLLLSSKDDVLIYDFNNAFSIKPVNWLAGLMHRRVIVCCHGELEYIANADKHSKWYKRKLSGLVNGFFNKERSRVNVSFVVFGEVIKKNLQSYLSDELNEHIYWIDHPVIGEASKQNKQDESLVPRIGTNGILNNYKGLETYIKVADKLNGVGNIRFVAVGNVQGDADRLREAGVEIYNSNAVMPLSDEEYAAGVKSLDFIVMMYPTDTYRLIASGAILDAIRYERPVIALRTEYAQYLFDKYGTFGYLADDENQLIELLLSAHTLNRDFDYQGIAQSLSPESLAPKFGEIIKNSDNESCPSLDM